MTVTPPPPYDDSRRTRGGPTAAGPRRRELPARLGLIGAVIVVLLIFTSSSSIRSWWAHRVHDVTGGSWGGDYAIGLVIGLLPPLGVLVGALVARRRKLTGAVRLARMLLFGAVAFVVTYLLSPSPAHFLSQHPSTRVFDHTAPGYLAGVFTGAMCWLAALVVAALKVRSWWRRVRARHGVPPRPGTRHDGHRVIDV
ncbi:MAG TPA: hypothetical protein VFT62_08450 [Mycobacteriales bacterium]|nr:hypothetical protein [Mycobacteriales bacterium]